LDSWILVLVFAQTENGWFNQTIMKSDEVEFQVGLSPFIRFSFLVVFVFLDLMLTGKG